MSRQTRQSGISRSSLLLHLQLFKPDPFTGITHVALSSDSTCVNNLYTAQDGYETLHLQKLEDPEPSQEEQNLDGDQSECIFPDWMQGKWEGVEIDRDQMSFRDTANFVTYRGGCVRSTVHTDRFVVKLKTDCGKPAHFCALFQQRDVNVMEFQLGKKQA